MVKGIPLNKNDSKYNYGIYIDDSKIISSGPLSLTGIGGDGGRYFWHVLIL